jgi:hypothetical protein
MAVPVSSISCCVLNQYNLFCQLQNALPFNWDTCCHLVLCLLLLSFHWSEGIEAVYINLLYHSTFILCNLYQSCILLFMGQLSPTFTTEVKHRSQSCMHISIPLPPLLANTTFLRELILVSSAYTGHFTSPLSILFKMTVQFVHKGIVIEFSRISLHLLGSLTQ